MCWGKGFFTQGSSLIHSTSLRQKRAKNIETRMCDSWKTWQLLEISFSLYTHWLRCSWRRGSSRKQLVIFFVSKRNFRVTAKLSQAPCCGRSNYATAVWLLTPSLGQLNFPTICWWRQKLPKIYLSTKMVVLIVYIFGMECVNDRP